VFSSNKKANWLAPEGGSQAAKGVVLFMHGFAQGPNAYYENLKGLADAGFLVIAPEPPFGATPGKQQASMVEYAAYFHSKIVSNTLTGLPMPSGQDLKVGLLGHSVGAGLATYVAQQAATQQQSFTSVMYMAPQTEVVKQYLPATAINSWPQGEIQATGFGLQYGLKDDLAPPELSTTLEEQLRKKGLDLDPADVTVFPDGTHVGFEDQVVLGDAEVTSDILPWLNPLLWWLITALSSLGVPFLPYLLGQLYKRRVSGGLLGAEEEEEGERRGIFNRVLINPQDIALLEQQAARRAQAQVEERLQEFAPQPDGIGPPEEVNIASAEASALQYLGLLAVTIAAGFFFFQKAFDDGEVHWLPLLGTLVTAYLTYEGVYYLRLQNYVDTVQRPQSREVARKFFTSTLLSRDVAAERVAV